MQDLISQTCHIALGANLPSPTGTALVTLQNALGLFSREHMNISKKSEWYSTPAFPAGSGPDFVNAVVKVETTMSAKDVLFALHRIEEAMGRTRDNRWEPRLCDLDLLDYEGAVYPDLSTFERWKNLDLDSQTSQTPAQLILPHPRIQDRAFVLIPLQDVSPDWVHPISKTPISDLIAALPAENLVEITPIHT